MNAGRWIAGVALLVMLIAIWAWPIVMRDRCLDEGGRWDAAAARCGQGGERASP